MLATTTPNQMTSITPTRQPLTWKVSVNNQQVGYVFKTRYSWGYCNARTGGMPRTFVCSDAKDQDDAVAKLIDSNHWLIGIANEIVDGINSKKLSKN